MPTTISDALLRSIVPTREIGAHKWGVGGLLVIAGAPQYPGAAWMASRSAGRNGAGIVYLATPRSVVATMASAMPEVAFVPLPDSDSPVSARRAVERMQDVLTKVKAVVIGPGLGNDESTDHLLTTLFGFGNWAYRSLEGFGFGAEESDNGTPDSIFTLTDVPIVMDADGLNWLSQQEDWWERVPRNRLVLTPHPGEAHRLSGLSVDEVVANPPDVARSLAEKWQQAVIIKSGFTAVSDSELVVVSDLAPTSLATAGSGDCFAGALGAFLAQGCTPMNAATLAIGVGARAALLAEAQFGVGGVLSADLPDMMAIAMQQLVINGDTGDTNGPKRTG